jgi:hypothetical protein
MGVESAKKLAGKALGRLLFFRHIVLSKIESKQAACRHSLILAYAYCFHEFRVSKRAMLKCLHSFWTPVQVCAWTCAYARLPREKGASPPACA